MIKCYTFWYVLVVTLFNIDDRSYGLLLTKWEQANVYKLYYLSWVK